MLPAPYGHGMNIHANDYLDPLQYLNQANLQLLKSVKFASEDDFVQRMHQAFSAGAQLDVTDSDGSGLLEIAVRRNSLRIVQALVSAGALVRRNPPDSFTLLMQAAKLGNADMICFFIDRLGMSVNRSDKTGQTALHYAVKSRSEAAVAALLKREADTTAAAYFLPADEFTSLFGDYRDTPDAGITPIALGAAICEHGLVQRLLEYSVEITGEWLNPLWVAINNQDAAMLKLMLAHCELVWEVGTTVDQALLEHAVKASDRTPLLEQLLDCQKKHLLPAVDLNAALLKAIELQHVDQAVALIDAGARPEAFAAADKPIWQAAAMQQDGVLYELLTVAQSAPFEALMTPSQHGHAPMLTELCKLAQHLPDLAEHGIAEAMILSILPALNALAQRADEYSPAQLAHETAYLLTSSEFGLMADATATDTQTSTATMSDSSSADKVPETFTVDQLQRATTAASPSVHAQKIHQTMAARQTAMRELAESTMQELATILAQALTPAYFVQARESPEFDGWEYTTMQMRLFDLLRYDLGIPETIAWNIADSWNDADAAPYAFADGPVDTPVEELRQFAHWELISRLQSLRVDEGSIDEHCKLTLLNLLEAQRARALPLLQQPTRVLRALEQRQGLRPVDVPALSQSLQQATGLLLDTCQSIAILWQRSVTEVHDSNEPVNAAGLARQLDRAFARRWQWIVAEPHKNRLRAPLFLTDSELEATRDWCEQALIAPANPPKRSADEEADGAPPDKSIRLN